MKQKIAKGIEAKTRTHVGFYAVVAVVPDMKRRSLALSYGTCLQFRKPDKLMVLQDST